MACAAAFCRGTNFDNFLATYIQNARIVNVFFTRLGSDVFSRILANLCVVGREPRSAPPRGLWVGLLKKVKTICIDGKRDGIRTAAATQRIRVHIGTHIILLHQLL